MTTKRWVALMMALALCLLSGCSTLGSDIITQLRPPKTMGEYGEAEEALSAYISEMLAGDGYTLKYPRSGDYRAAFIMEDLDSDGLNEALVFYDVDTDTAHINLLHQSGGEWRSVNDLTVHSADIHSVTFGDMDGDGVRELFVCWDMFSNRTYQVSVYTLNGNRIAERMSAACSSLVVEDLTRDGRDDCLLLNADAQMLSASLWTLSGNAMTEVGRCTVDGYVQNLRTVQTVTFREDYRAVFVDCEKSENLLVTQLLYWDNGALVAPFYSTANVGNVLTARPAHFPAGDVDEDGVWEWPTCVPLEGHSTESGNEATGWLTTFWNWDMTRREPVENFSCIYNDTDRYYLLADEEFAARFTTRYDKEERILWLIAIDTEETVFAIRTVPKKSVVSETTEDYSFTTLTKNDFATYEVWYDEENAYAINEEMLQYMVTAF